ncbi:efflux RND transporter periplasmic adaptor subunit [Hymenobacter endophyticus]|uniref:Efflux RND transporter periplasmic adaptor subunit n=1 Tax=Hymenobacter endophyticus TaxID=3076335 RepID=A0ABU3TKR1_9BACT|nr:efflux RND transporter periplasmic adaptor subunit [Hymenobacter endophyticus]MDU0371964.1 efflux RND transporter periplasmic adaptor subunit [Hymenobacter endophyticus]
MTGLAVVAGLSQCSPAETPATAAPAAPMAMPMATISLAKDRLQDTLSLPGELLPYQEVDLYAKVSSFVQELKVDVGSEVQAGQLLLVLEAPEISSQRAAARSRVQSLEATYLATKASYDRVREASRTEGAIAPDALDQITARKNADLAQLQAAKAALQEVGVMESYLELRAPFSGVITARNVDKGAYVGPAGKGSQLPLLTLQEQKKLRLVVSVPEAHRSYLNALSTVSFTVRSLPQTTFTGKIMRQAGALDQRLRSERIELDVPNAGKQLLPRMIADIRLPLAAKDSTFVVPLTAVTDSDEGVYVLKMGTNGPVKVPVRKGRQQGGKVEIFGRLAVGDKLQARAMPPMKGAMGAMK